MKFQKQRSISCPKSSFLMFKFILIFLLSISTETFTENGQKITKGFKPTAKDIKAAENNINNIYIQVAQTAKSMSADKLDELRKKFNQIGEEENDGLYRFFFEIWYQKNKSVLTEEEQKKYEQAWEKGLLIGMNENVEMENEFCIIQFPNEERYIIPTGRSYAEGTMLYVIAGLRVDDDVARVFNAVARDTGGIDNLLFNMLFMRVFNRSAKEWLKKAIF